MNTLFYSVVYSIYSTHAVPHISETMADLTLWGSLLFRFAACIFALLIAIRLYRYLGYRLKEIKKQNKPSQDNVNQIPSSS